MAENEEPSTSTFNINLVTGDVTLPVMYTQSSSVVVQSLPPPEAGQMLPPLTSDVPSSSKGYTGKAKPPGKVRAKEPLEKNSEEYIRRRQRNNVAVKKSREKTREKSAYTLKKVEQLKVENEQLESKIAILTKELSVLKDLFMEHARGFCAGGNGNLLSPEQLESLLGCKVIRERNEDQPTSSNAVEPSSPTISTTLINAAELEFMAFKDRTTTTVAQVSTENDLTAGEVVIIDNEGDGVNYVVDDS